MEYKRKYNKNYNNGYHMVPYYTSYNNYDENDYDEPDTKYQLHDIDNDSGWNILELETLYEIGFRIKNDDTMTCEVEEFSLSECDTECDTVSEKVLIDIYKTNEGYVLKTNKPNRRYVFETFNKMLNYIEQT